MFRKLGLCGANRRKDVASSRALPPIVTFPLLRITPLNKDFSPDAADVILLFMGWLHGGHRVPEHVGNAPERDRVLSLADADCRR